MSEMNERYNKYYTVCVIKEESDHFYSPLSVEFLIAKYNALNVDTFQSAFKYSEHTFVEI